MQGQMTFLRRIAPLSLTQFFGSLNDNAFKVLASLAVIEKTENVFQCFTFFALLALAYVLPFILFLAPAGALSDHIPKRYVILLTKALEVILMAAGTFALIFFDSWGWIPLLLIIFLMSMRSAFLNAALFSTLPEMFPEAELSSANGSISAVNYFGLIFGVLFAVFANLILKYDFLICGTVLCASACIGFLCSAAIVPVISLVQRKKELAYPWHESFQVGIKEFTAHYGRLLAPLGDSFFMGIGFAILFMVFLFAKYSLKDASPIGIVLLQISPILGMGIGCYLAGRLSGGKIELGLVPFGAFGVALAVPLAAFFPGESTELTLAVPRLFSGVKADVSMNLHLTAMMWMMLAGLSGGIFVTPLRTYYQQRSKPQNIGAAIALSNAITYLFILIASILAGLFLLGSIKTDPGIPEVLRKLAEGMPAFSPVQLLVSVGVATFLVTLFTMWVLPDFFLRFIIITLGHTLYKMRIVGASNIPERGACLLLSNHVSYIDAILLSACTSRRIRFMMHEEYFNIPILSPIARLTGFFKVPAAGKHKSMQLMFQQIRESLRRGEIICVFPEGAISRNGMVGAFKHGYEKMLPEDAEVTIIPACISYAWGSVFSYYYGNIKPRLPSKIPYFCTVTFGEPIPRTMSPFEVRQLITELGTDSARKPPSAEVTIHHSLARQAKQTPFRILVSDANGQSYSAFRLYQTAILLSREIRGMVSSDCRYVGIALPNSTSAAISILASLLADKAAAPLNYTTSQEVFELSVKKAGITCVITSREFLSKIKISQTPEMVFLEDIMARIPAWKMWLVALGILVLPYKELLNIVSPLSRRDLMGTAALLFSSGSTGIPKGVMLSHYNLSSDAYSFARGMGYSANDKTMGNLPLFHSFGLNVCLWMPILNGGSVTFVSSPLDANVICDTIERDKITVIFATPTFMQKYLHRCKPGQFDSLRMASTGAEKLRQNIVDKMEEITNGRLTIVEVYGCTELSPAATMNSPVSLVDLGHKYGVTNSIGTALPGVCIRIMDPLTFKPVPPDTEGLVFVKGPMVMQGYLNDQKLTDKVILDGYYNTGDIGKMDDAGYILICGRLSRFSKIAGEMVPHELVEGAINEICHSTDRVIAVGGIPDPTKGEALLVLYTDQTPLSPEEIVDQLRERSISNLWIPKVCNFHKIDHLPLLGSGKLDLSVLRQVADEIAQSRGLSKLK